MLVCEPGALDSSLLYWLGLITLQMSKPSPTQAVTHSFKSWMDSTANTEKVLSRSREPAEPLHPPDPSLQAQLLPTWKEKPCSHSQTGTSVTNSAALSPTLL